MPVRRLGTRLVADRPPSGAQAPGQVGVLVVEEQVVVEEPDLIQGRAPQRDCGAAETEDLTGGPRAVVRLHPVAVAAAPCPRDEVAGGIQQLGPGQPNPRGDRGDSVSARGIERVDQCG